MEVDMQSPPPTFRTAQFNIKRPRSPGSPTQERQTKRLSLAPVGQEGQCVRRASTASDGVVDSDWLRQARELSIASPLSLTVGFPTVLDGATVAQSRADENMAVDCEESQTLRVHVHQGISRSWTTTRAHLPSIHVTTTTPPPVPSAPSPAPFSVFTETPASSTDSASSASVSSAPVTQGRTLHPCPPDIFLFPATPSDCNAPFTADLAVESEPGRVRMQDQSVPDREHGSPRPSRMPDVPTPSGRKHRVTMGPRADCIKCRTGVRGHWMHFD